MSQKFGKLVICDRCGQRIFLKYLKTKFLNGGYDSVDYFEKMPEGWEVRSGIGLLCPECNADYKKMVDEFMGGSHEDDSESL